MNTTTKNPANKIKTWLFNPFHFIAGGTTLAIGLVVIIVTALLAPVVGISFHGILQTSIVSYGFLSELSRQFVLIVSITGMLWVAGKFLSKSDFRLIDLASTQMVARLPVQLYALIGFSIPSVHEAMTTLATRTEDGQVILNPGDVNMLPVTLMGVAGLVFMAWTIVLMYQSFSVSCNVKGGKAIAVFAALLIVADILSRVLNSIIHVMLFR